MTYLAYDPDLLRMLEVRTRAALEQVRRLRNDDPEAADAMRIVRDTARHLEDGLLPVVHRILLALPLRAPIDDRDDLPAVQNSLARFMALQRGWAVAPDPLADDPTRSTVEEAAALGRRLQELKPGDIVDDPERLAWVTNELDVIGRDERLAAAFAAEFHAWAEWTTALARPRALHVAQLDGGIHVGVDQLDAAIAALAHVARHTIRPHDVALPWLDRIDPYAAALIVRDLGLAGERLATMVDRVLVRPSEELDDLAGENTADVLLKTLLAEPSAMPPFLMAVMWHPAALFDHLVDPTLADQVILRGSDPALVDPDTARRIVVPVLEFFAQDTTRDPGTLLADLIVPWTPYFAPTRHDWVVDDDRAAVLIGTALRADGALDRFVGRADDIVAGAQRAFATGAHAVADFTSYVGMIGQLIVNERIHRLDLRDRAWNALFSIASLVASFVPGALVGTAVTLGLVAVQRAGAPDLAYELRQTKRAADAALAAVEVALVRSIYADWLAQGRITADTPEPPTLDLDGPNIPSNEFLGDYFVWLDQLPGGEDGDLGLEVRRKLGEVTNGWITGEHAVDSMARDIFDIIGR